MKRIIKDYKSISQEQLNLIAIEFPEGFSLDDLITFRKPDGDSFKGLEIKTEDAIYLFKIDTRMLEVIDDHTDDDFVLDTFAESKDYEFDNTGSEDDDEEEDDQRRDNDEDH